MQELIAEFLAQVRAVWNRRWLALTIAWAVCLTVWAIVLMLPDRYQARASVFVDTATPLRPVLEGLAIGDDPQAQLLLVREALLARPNLEIVARKSKLDAHIKSAHEMDNLILGLQTDLKVTTASVRGNGTENVYTITYQHPMRDTAVQVVRTLLDDFVAGTLSGNQLGSTDAQDFLRSQIAEYEKRLSDAEARLAEFKKKNIGLIPGERGDYFARLDGAMNALQTARTNVAVTESRREALLAQMNSVQPYLPGSSQTQSGAGLAATPDVSIRLQEAQGRLEELLLRFTEKHPEVVALKQTIADLKEREARELAELQKGGAGTGAIRSLSANPVYQSVQLQLNQINVELASLHGAIRQYESTIADLKKVVDSAPEVEQEYARLNRDYGVTKTQYEALLRRLDQAKVSDDAAKRGSIKFNMIEPPNSNMRPMWPNRPLLMIAGLFGGLLVGAGFAVLLNLMSPTVNDAVRLARESGVRVLGTISRFQSRDERRASRLRFLHFATVAGALVVCCGGLVVFGNAGARAIHQWLA
jgi:polysaccharide chain length determinant protein (PEP-CTERM system associated)